MRLILALSSVLLMSAPRAAVAEDEPVCWAPPATALKKEPKARLAAAMTEAAQSTRPPHARRAVLALDSAASAKTAALECAAVVSTELAIGKKSWTLTLRLKDGEARELGSSAVVIDPKALAASDLTAAWTSFWKAIDPPPPPPPPPVAAAPEPDPVDRDLAVERAREAPAPEAEAPRRAELMLATGLAMRSLESPGTPIDNAALLSFGGDATLRVGSWIGAPHALDLGVGYRRRLARVVVDGEALSADVDRFGAEAAYRYALGSFSAGPLVGWEVLRFEVDPRADALSVRYGVIRAGLGARQQLVEGDVAVHVAASFALRIAPGGDADLGFDAAGGPVITFGDRFTARAQARWARQSGDLGGGFEDQHIDVELGVGVLL